MLLFFTLAVAIGLGCLFYRARRQDRAVARLEALGALVFYDARDRTTENGDPLESSTEPPQMGWFQRLTGLRPTDEIVSVEMFQSQLRDEDQELFAELSGLRELQARDAGINDAGCRSLAGLSQIKRLDLYRCPVTDEGLKHFGNLRSLLHLNLRCTQVRGHGFRFLRDLPELLWIEMECDNSSEIDGLDNLWQLKAVIRLSLRGRGFTDEHLVGIDKLLTLEELELIGTSVSGPALASVGRCGKLQELKLQGSPITDEGIALLAGHSGLRRVTLHGTKVTAKCAEALARCPSLENIVLSKTDFDDAGLSELTTMRSLKHLSLYHSAVTAEGVALFEKARRDVHVSGVP